MSQLAVDTNALGYAPRAGSDRLRAVTFEALLAMPLAAGIGLWAVSLRHVDLGRMTDLGLMSVLPPTMYAALGAVTVGFFLALGRKAIREWVLGLHAVALIAIVHATPAILYGTLRYAWAWKHVGIVDYIGRHGSVNPDISFLAAYHNWPGFFALVALFTKLAGLHSALSFASWAPVFFNLLFLAGLVVLFRALTPDPRLRWLAVWFFFVANWIGQDYFSPQAFTYFLYLALLGVCLTWFKLTAPPESTIARWLRVRWLARTFRQLLVHADATTPTAEPVTPLQRVALSALAVGLVAVIVSSHQLTPLMALLGLTGLVVCQRIGSRHLPLLVTVSTAGWIAYAAVGFLRGNLYWVVDSIGQTSSNVNGTLINLGNASHGQVLVAHVDRALTLGVIGLAAAGFVRRLRAGRLDLAAGLLAITPVFMLPANSYGGEMLFRVYFFALPFLALLAAGLVFPANRTRRAWPAACFGAVISGVLLVGFLFAYYGKERQNYFTKDEVAASTWLYRSAPPGSLIASGVNDYPWAFTNYERYSYFAIGEQRVPVMRKLLARPARSMADLIGGGSYPAGYVIITRSQKAATDETGLMPAGTLERVERALAASPRFRTVYRSHDTAIFRYRASTS